MRRKQEAEDPDDFGAAKPPRPSSDPLKNQIRDGQYNNNVNKSSAMGPTATNPYRAARGGARLLRPIESSQTSINSSSEEDDDSLDVPGATRIRGGRRPRSSVAAGTVVYSMGGTTPSGNFSREDEEHDDEENFKTTGPQREEENGDERNSNLVTAELAPVIAECTVIASEKQDPDQQRYQNSTMWKIVILVVVAVILIGAAVLATLLVVSSKNNATNNNQQQSSIIQASPLPTTSTSDLPTPVPTLRPTSIPTLSPTPLPTSNPTVDPVLFRSAANTDLCLTIPNDTPVNFDPVYIDTCGAGLSQEFVLDIAGYFRFQLDPDFCIEGDSNLFGEAGNNKIFVYQPCIDQWRYRPDCTLINIGQNENKCLTSNPGNELTLEACDNTSLFQKWYSSSNPQCTG